MPTLIDKRGRRDDLWTTPASGAEAATCRDPAGMAPKLHRHLLLPLADWLARRDELLAEAGAGAGAGGGAARLKLGVELGPADDPSQLADDLDELTLIAIQFPRFTDGRGYSIARQLRDRYEWRGELRAIGDVLHDQLFYLARCGFDTFALREDQNVDAALGAFRVFSEAYQASVDRGPLFERRQVRIRPEVQGRAQGHAQGPGS